MAKINEVDITSLTFQEGSAPTTPASTKWKAYFKSTGLFVIDDTGTELGPLSTGTSFAAIATFTPTWTATSVNPAIGNGTLTGHYQQIATKLYWFSIHMLAGSTTTFGTGNWSFGNLPFTVKSTAPIHQTASAVLVDSGTASYTSTARLARGGTVVSLLVAGETSSRHVNATVPFTWVNTDWLTITGVIASD